MALANPRKKPVVSARVKLSSVEPNESMTMYAAPRCKIELLDLPEFFYPFHSKLGYDYWKCFANNNIINEGNVDDAYEKWGVDKEDSCIIVVRPDQQVSLFCDLDNVQQLEQYFSAILIPGQGYRRGSCKTIGTVVLHR